MSIKIPLNNRVSGGSIGGKISISAGTNVIKAQESLNSAIGGVGQQMFDTAVKLKRVENERLLSEHKAGFKRMTAEYQNDLINNHDPASWQAGYKERFGQQMSKVDTSKLSPEAQEAFQDWSTNYESEQELRITRDATLQNVKNAGMTMQNNVEEYVERKDFDSARDEVKNSSFLSPEEKRQSLNNLLKKEKSVFEADKLERLEVMRGNDPFTLAEELEKNAHGLSDFENQKQIEKTKRAISNFQAKEYGSILEAVEMGDIETPDAVDSRGEKLSEYQRFKLKQSIAKRNDKAYQDKIRTPEMQQQIAGKVMSMIDGYDPNGEDFDKQYVDILTELQGMDKSPMRDEIKGRLDGIRQGMAREIKTVKDWTMKQSKEAYDAGLFGKVGEAKKIDRSVRDHLNDGFFNDDDKLESLGLSKSEIKRIQKADSLAEQVDEFKELWGKNTGEVTADKETLDLVDKMRQGRGNLDKNYSSYEDPQSLIDVQEQEEAVYRRRGQVDIELEQAFKLNPKMSMDEAGKLLERLSVDVSAGDTNESWRPSKPSRDTGKVPATYSDHKGAYRVINKTRDQITGFSSKPGNRMISLDFNDADNKSARGIEIKVPKDATNEEIKAAEAWARETQDFYKKNGINVPLRHGNGIKRDGRGVSGVFHTEPFFASNKAAIKLLQNKPKEYAEIVGRTLGNIQGAAFIPPHKSNDPGAVVGNINERDFATNTILPYL